MKPGYCCEVDIGGEDWWRGAVMAVTLGADR